MQDFKKLKVWEKSHRLAVAVYRTTRGFAREELYGLTSQLRRAATSIPTNIAEGCGRRGRVELARFLTIAAGSASELEHALLLAHDLDLTNSGEHARLEAYTLEIKRMLTALIKKLRTR